MVTLGDPHRVLGTNPTMLGTGGAVLADAAGDLPLVRRVPVVGVVREEEHG